METHQLKKRGPAKGTGGRPKGTTGTPKPVGSGRNKDKPVLKDNAKNLTLSIRIGNKDILLLGNGNQAKGKAEALRFLKEQLTLFITSKSLQK